MAIFRNPGSSPIEVKIGELPGDPPHVYRCEPGGEAQWPANYEGIFVRAGMVVVKQLGPQQVIPQEVRELRQEVARLHAELAKLRTAPVMTRATPGEEPARPTIGEPSTLGTRKPRASGG